jgi:transposase
VHQIHGFPIIVIQEAGLDGFWIHRVLESEGIDSYIVDPASIATSRRRRRAKTDKLDGETLVRALLADKRGEPRVCSMVKAPSPEDEDRRRITRERKVLTSERIQHVNRIKGLLFAQGICGYEPLHRDRREQLDQLRTGDGRALPKHIKAQIGRELDRLELLLEQVKIVEAERDALLAAAPDKATPAAAAMLLDIKGVGPEFAGVLWSEGCSAVSTIDGRWRPMPAWHRLHGKAARSTGTRSVEIRQSTAANNHGPARLAMAAPSAALGADPVVP